MSKKRIRSVFLLSAFVSMGGLFSSCSFNSNTGGNNISLDPEIQKIIEFYNVLMNESLYDISGIDAAGSMINGFTDELNDPFTFYTGDLSDQGLATSGVGIGFTRSVYNGEALVVDVMKGSPADAKENGIAKLQIGDIIYAVSQIENGEEVDKTYLKSMSYKEWSNKLFIGETGSVVRFYIKRGNEEIVSTFTRRPYNQNKVTFDNSNSDYMYIKIDTFLGNPTSTYSYDGKVFYESYPGLEINEYLIEELNSNHPIKNKDIIFDLRDNGGGYVSNMVDCMRFFVENTETVMKYKRRDGTTYDLNARNSLNQAYLAHEYLKLEPENILVLVNESTASASESFAMALKDLCGAKIVGNTSYGKGIAQTFYTFNDGSVLRYTFAEVLPPISDGINGVGIIPDYQVGYNKDEQIKYRGYVEGTDLNDKIEYESKKVIIDQVNLVLDTQYDYYHFLDSVTYFQNQFGLLDKNGLFDKETADLLQAKVYDKFEENRNQTLEYAKGLLNGR